MSIKSLPPITILNGPLSLKEGDTCFKYSENVPALKALMNEVKIIVTFLKCAPYFDGDKDRRAILEISVLRGEKKIIFAYGMSIKDTESFTLPADKKRDFSTIARERNEIAAGLLYHILSCIASEFHCPDTFHDFCSEFGYDEDSRKAEKTFHACLEQSRKLHDIFTDEDIECLPR